MRPAFMPPSGSGSPTHTAPVPHWESWTHALVQNASAVGSWSTVHAYAFPRPRFTHSPPLTVQYLPTLRSLPGSPGITHGVLPPLELLVAMELAPAAEDALPLVATVDVPPLPLACEDGMGPLECA